MGARIGGRPNPQAAFAGACADPRSSMVRWDSKQVS